MDDEFMTVLTTTDKRVDADRIAHTLVEAKLAGCVQVLGPMQSTYRWKGKVETTEEWLCLVKTRSTLYDAVEGAIRELHPYEVPEIVALPIVRGSRSYLDWLSKSVED
jgi:periplasmic divalent cation tolerance protein